MVLGWLCYCLGFSLLRTAIQCIQGARSSIGVYSRTPPPMDLVTVESCLLCKDFGLVFDGFCLVFQHMPSSAGGGWQGQTILPRKKMVVAHDGFFCVTESLIIYVLLLSTNFSYTKEFKLFKVEFCRARGQLKHGY